MQTAHETKSRGNESDIRTVRNMSEIATENMVYLKDIVGSMPILNLKGTTRKGSKEKFPLETECGPKNPCPPLLKGRKQEPLEPIKNPKGKITGLPRRLR